jgi:competence protein ComEC
MKLFGFETKQTRILKYLLLTVIILLFPSDFVDQSFSGSNSNHKIVYTMINACTASQQADAHVLRFANGTTYVIDVGNKGIIKNYLVEYLKKNNIKTIDKIFISHAHKDHYEGIIDVINAGIKIDSVYFNVPDKEVCDTEKPWGCDYEHVNSTIRYIQKQGISVVKLNMGDTFYPVDKAVMKVIAVYDGKNTPIGRTDINDTSAIMKLSYGRTSVLFTGDLNLSLSNYLVKNSNELKADILKVPHHGTEGVASNDFFDAVSPKLALVPAPKDLWLSDRSKRIRDYFLNKNIPVIVSGINSDTTVILYEDGYEAVKKTGFMQSNEIQKKFKGLH